MSFCNNIEAMAFDKSGWALIEEAKDGSVIYMGKPLTKDASTADPVWTIKRIMISENTAYRTTTVQVAEGRHSWEERESLTYRYF